MPRTSKFEPAFKTKVVLEALKEQQTLSQLSAKYQVSPKQITQWKAEFLEKSATIFETGKTKEEKQMEDLKIENEKLYKIVGQLAVEVDFFQAACERKGLLKK